MTDYIWVVELAIKPGQLENFKTLMNEMVVAIQANEPGTLNYQLFISDDNSTSHIYEQYTDGAAFKQHLANFEPFAERFGEAVDVTAFTVYGNLDAETREILNGFDATIMPPLVGFAR